MAWTYLLRCADDSYYVGSTIDLPRRVWQHQEGRGASHTRRRRPVELVWCAEFTSVVDAFAFEKQVRRWRRDKREALIAGRWDLLPRLASRCWSAQQSRPSPDAPPPPIQHPAPVMPWDVPHERPSDPDDPWAPLVPRVDDEPSP
jgi:putative endonuclease